MFAQDSPDMRNCASADVSVHSTVQACTRLVQAGRLSAPKMARVLVNLASAHMVLGNITLALRYYDDASAQDSTLFYIYPNRAYALEKAGYPQAAMRDYDYALSVQPDDRASLFGRGVLHLRSANPAAAIADFDRILSRDNTDVDAWFNRGLASKAIGRQQDAVRDFSSVLRLKPDDPAAWLERGRVREGTDPQAALDDFAAAIRVAPEWAEIYVARGRLHDRMSRKADADRDFMRAFDLGYQADWLTERITSLRGG